MSKNFKKKEKQEFDQKLIDIARVVRIVAGGRRFRFRATMVIGNHKGKVGMGIGKAGDVTSAIAKAVDKAKKNMIFVPMENGTIPHEILVRHDGAEIYMKPAREGTGIIAGGPVRAVVELAGIKNVVSKMRGSSNKPNNVTAAIKALTKLRLREDIAKARGVVLPAKKKKEEKVVGKPVVDKKDQLDKVTKNKPLPKVQDEKAVKNTKKVVK